MMTGQMILPGDLTIEECIYCMEEFKKGDVTLLCGSVDQEDLHRACSTCFIGLVKSRDNCPVCRRDLLPIGESVAMFDADIAATVEEALAPPPPVHVMDLVPNPRARQRLRRTVEEVDEDIAADPHEGRRNYTADIREHNRLRNRVACFALRLKKKRDEWEVLGARAFNTREEFAKMDKWTQKYGSLETLRADVDRAYAESARFLRENPRPQRSAYAD